MRTKSRRVLAMLAVATVCAAVSYPLFEMLPVQHYAVYPFGLGIYHSDPPEPGVFDGNGWQKCYDAVSFWLTLLTAGLAAWLSWTGRLARIMRHVDERSVR